MNDPEKLDLGVNSYPLTGADSLTNYKNHINRISNPGQAKKNYQYLKSLKKQTRDNFQNLNLKLG